MEPGEYITVQAVREIALVIAREEIASFAGLVMKRLQGCESVAVDAEGFEFTVVTPHDLQHIFGELLRDFGATESEPGGVEEE